MHPWKHQRSPSPSSSSGDISSSETVRPTQACRSTSACDVSSTTARTAYCNDGRKGTNCSAAMGFFVEDSVVAQGAWECEGAASPMRRRRLCQFLWNPEPLCLCSAQNIQNSIKGPLCFNPFTATCANITMPHKRSFDTGVAPMITVFPSTPDHLDVDHRGRSWMARYSD